MTGTRMFRIGDEWQRATIAAAASYLREVLAREPGNVQVKALHEGLLEVLDPVRRVLREQRELAHAAKAEKADRRRGERRAGVERRQKDLRVPKELDRRSGAERRTADRRKT